MQPHNVSSNELRKLYENLTKIIEYYKEKTKEQGEFAFVDGEFDDSSNAWMYILFVLAFYAFSIAILMVKYIRREREGSKLEFYYNEFVKRDWYKDRNLYDSRGKRIHYKVTGNQVEREVAEVDRERKKSVLLCVGEAASLIGVAPIEQTGARPKRSSLKNWPPPGKTVKCDDGISSPPSPSLPRLASRLTLARVDEATKVPAAHFTSLEEMSDNEEPHVPNSHALASYT